MIGAAAAYMSGLFFASFFTFGSAFIPAAAIAVLLIVFSRRLGITKGDIIMLAVFFVSALCISSVYTAVRYDAAVIYNGQNGSFSGEITSVDYYDEDKASYVLDGRINGNFKVKAVYFGEAYDASVGDTLAVESCTFTVPDSDYLFDSAGYYKSDGIFLAIEKAEGITLTANKSMKLTNALLDYKNKVKSDFMVHAGEKYGGLISAMVFGDKENISDSMKTSMYRIGIGHVMAVSGLHVSIIASALMLFLKRLRVNRYFAFLMMNIVIAAMIIMAESPISAVRAAIMVNFIHAAGLFRRQNDTLNSLSCAVLIICIFNPYAIYSSGFLLSVSGTFGIGVFAPYMTRSMKKDTVLNRLIKNIIQMLCVTLCVMPLSVLYFDEVSLISPVTNVLLIPFCAAVLFIGILYTFTGGLISLLSFAALLSELIFFLSDKLSGLEIAYFSCGNDRLFFISAVFAAFVFLAYMIFRSRRITALALACSVTVFIFVSVLMSSLQQNKFRIAVLGRGSEAVVVVNYSGRADVIDISGHYKSPEYLRKYLSANGITSVSLLALTEDVHSQYAAYSSGLELVEIENLLICGENKSVDSAVLFPEDGFTVANKNYEISYTDGCLTVEYADITAVIISAKKCDNTSADITVAYGNVTRNTVLNEDGRTIYLDEYEDSSYKYKGMNNFEIEIAENGELSIRRL